MTSPTDIARRLPAGFLLGAATSSYQIEGAVDADGRGRSIWDVFSHTPGRTYEGHTGDTGVDHYRRMEQDVALMAEMGLEAYRFSIAWPRVVPDGDGDVEPRGLAFYRRLAEALRAHGITPIATLYHWDLPQALQDRGGWASRATADAFTRYARLTHAELGDVVDVWHTVNEPWCSSFLGYGSGVHAPGITDPRAALRAAHHLMLGHGDAVAAMRAGGGGTFGFVPNLYGVVPASDSDADARAAATIDALQNRLWLDAALLGRYPDEVTRIMERFGADDAVQDGDLARIAQPLDQLGVNYYSRYHVEAREADDVGYATTFPGAEHVRMLEPPLPHTDMGWGIEPHGLRDVLVRLREEWSAPPVIVCENGAAFHDAVVGPDGVVQDHDRRDFIARHLSAVCDAIDAGADVTGYLAWSLLDNFEWAFGYAKRFGIVHVHPQTLDRTVKLSGRWFTDLLSAHRERRRVAAPAS